jgi:hypothetical protein
VTDAGLASVETGLASVETGLASVETGPTASRYRSPPAILAVTEGYNLTQKYACST